MLQTPLRFLVPKHQESSSSSASNLPLVLHPLCFLGRCLVFFPSISLSFLFLFPLLGFLKCVYQAKRFSSRSPLYFPAEKIALKKSRHKDDTSTRKCPITTRWAVAQQLYFFFTNFKILCLGEKKVVHIFIIFLNLTFFYLLDTMKKL